MSARFLSLMIGCLGLILPAFAGRAQDVQDKKEQPYVSWVSQYPQHNEPARKSTFKRICNFLVGKNEQSALVRPVGIIAENPGSFWILDQGKETIFDVEGNKRAEPKPIRRKENYFTSLISACSLPDGEMLFTDSRLNKVFRYSNEDKKLREVNDTLQLQQPTGIAYSSVTGEIWIVETSAHRISVLNKDGVLLRRMGMRGDEPGQFNFPTSIWIDNKGDAYVVDAMNFRVQIFNKEGVFVSAFGEAGDSGGSFARPKGIATDTYGNIYVADALFHAVQIFDRTGNFLYSFGRQGREKEEFWMPSGIYIDSKNYIYVADTYNSRIQVFQLINGG